MNKLTLWILITLVSVSLVWCGQKTKQVTDTPAPTENPAPVIANPNTVESGDVIKIDYTGSADETGIFDTSIEETAKEAWTYNPQRTYEPLEFTVWAGMMIPGMESGVVGMKLNEEKTLVIPPEDGYGQWTEDRVQELPLSNFEEAGITPTVWEMYNFWIAQWKVLEINEETVKLDFNNPLAGKTLTFKVKVQEIIKAAVVE